MISHSHVPLHSRFMQVPFLSCRRFNPGVQVDGFVVGLHNLYNFANLVVAWLKPELHCSSTAYLLECF